MRKLLTLWIVLAAFALAIFGIIAVRAMPVDQQIIYFGGQSSANNPSAPTGFLLMVDGVSHVLRADGVSKICLAGGCPPSGGTTATFNPAFKGTGLTLSNGNLTATYSGSSFTNVGSTVSKSSGKFYSEFTIGQTTNANMEIGIGNSSLVLNGDYLGQTNDSISVFADGNEAMNANFGGVIGPTFVAGMVVCMAVDLTAKLIWFRGNGGNWNGGGTNNPATGTGGFSFSTMNAGPYFPAAGFHNSADAMTANFGATSYAQTAPSGFGNWQ